MLKDPFTKEAESRFEACQKGKKVYMGAETLLVFNPFVENHLKMYKVHC
jgi:hypothetical protein